MKNILVLILSVLGPVFSFAAVGDTAKVKWDINDPRNPDCPCHKYQQLADEEYQKQMANDYIIEGSKELAKEIVLEKELAKSDVANLIVKNAQAKKNIPTSKLVGTKKLRHSSFGMQASTHGKSSLPKKRRVRFGRKDNSRCTHW